MKVPEYSARGGSYRAVGGPLVGSAASDHAPLARSARYTSTTPSSSSGSVSNGELRKAAEKSLVNATASMVLFEPPEVSPIGSPLPTGGASGVFTHPDEVRELRMFSRPPLRAPGSGSRLSSAT